MDYKYIDQLLDRYWNCETTLEEEEILRAFFSQDNVPVELLRYRQLFIYEDSEPQADRLGDDFDERLLQQVGNTGEPVYTGMGNEVITSDGSNVALVDTAKIDTVKQSSIILPVDDGQQLLK